MSDGCGGFFGEGVLGLAKALKTHPRQSQQSPKRVRKSATTTETKTLQKRSRQEKCRRGRSQLISRDDTIRLGGTPRSDCLRAFLS